MFPSTTTFIRDEALDFHNFVSLCFLLISFMVGNDYKYVLHALEYVLYLYVFTLHCLCHA